MSVFGYVLLHSVTFSLLQGITFDTTTTETASGTNHSPRDKKEGHPPPQDNTSLKMNF